MCVNKKGIEISKKLTVYFWTAALLMWVGIMIAESVHSIRFGM